VPEDEKIFFEEIWREVCSLDGSM